MQRTIGLKMDLVLLGVYDVTAHSDQSQVDFVKETFRRTNSMIDTVHIVRQQYDLGLKEAYDLVIKCRDMASTDS